MDANACQKAMRKKSWRNLIQKLTFRWAHHEAIIWIMGEKKKKQNISKSEESEIGKKEVGE